MRKFILLLVIPFVMYACNTTNKTEENQDEPASMLESSNEEKGVYFVSPSDGDTVNNPVKVVFGVSGMEIEPAGTVNEGKGHHHIVIDGGYIDKGVVVPADSMNIHYGKGQTETEITLSPGKHTLTMQFADGFHQSYGKEWSKTIELNVEK
ncbi:MAG: DUF4399 domain-containing protein [Cyclobacteriaceae bacterium]|nr:DUF4399 domain-containing protein [Cyclobacteriaceae bacterium]